MARLMTLLILFALIATNGPAVAAAMCQHQDPGAHAAARLSHDSAIAAAALDEETAGKAAQDLPLSEAAGTLLAGYMLPPEAGTHSSRTLEPAQRHARENVELASRSDPPLLEPPLA